MNTCPCRGCSDPPLKCKYSPYRIGEKTAINSQTIVLFKCNCLNIYFIKDSVKIQAPEVDRKKTYYHFDIILKAKAKNSSDINMISVRKM